MERDAATFFDIDIPALLGWNYTAADAALIAGPVLYVGGTDSGRWFAEVRELLLAGCHKRRMCSSSEPITRSRSPTPMRSPRAWPPLWSVTPSLEDKLSS
jgi:hypothetical protein